MVVWREHGANPPDVDRAHLLAMLRAVADERFGADGYRVDEHMRNIPDHFHAHARRRAYEPRFGASRDAIIPGEARPKP